MPILFGTLAALVMVIAAWTTYKNQDEYKHQISLREKQEVALDKNNKIKQDRKDEFAEEKAATEQLIVDNKGLTKDLAKTLTVKTDLDNEIKAKQRQILTIKSEVDAANEILKDLGDVETLIPKIERIKTEIAQLKDDIDKEEANLAGLKQVQKATQSDIDVKLGEAERIAQGKSQTKLTTSIKTVYSNWGFVTLNGGDIQGVVPDSILDVVRGDEVIAKLKVTTVEPNRAAADILRDSIKGEFFLRSGDKVVAESEGVNSSSPQLGNEVTPMAKPASVPSAPQVDADPF